MLPSVLLAVGSVAKLAANVAVAQPTATGWVIAAWSSFPLITTYELLMRQARRSAAASGTAQRAKPRVQITATKLAERGNVRSVVSLSRVCTVRRLAVGVGASGEQRRQAWQWALTSLAKDGSLPCGREIACQASRHKRWGRLVKRSGAAGKSVTSRQLSEAGLLLVEKPLPPATGG